MWRGRRVRRYSITDKCGAKLPRCVVRVPRVFTSGAEVSGVAFKDIKQINKMSPQKAAVSGLMYKCRRKYRPRIYTFLRQTEPEPGALSASINLQHR